jgi:hypothetical protein
MPANGHATPGKPHLELVPLPPPNLSGPGFDMSDVIRRFSDFRGYNGASDRNRLSRIKHCLELSLPDLQCCS